MNENLDNRPKRTSSYFTGLLLILLGAILLLDRFDPALRIGHLIRVYWPLLLVFWGGVKLAGQLAAHRAGRERPPLLSGGEAALFILLAVVLSSLVLRDWIRGRYSDLVAELPSFRAPYTRTQQLSPQTIPAGARVVIETVRGDITVRGGGSEILARATEATRGLSQSSANQQLQGLAVTLDRSGDTFRLHPAPGSHWAYGASVDLDVQLPASASISAATTRGDIRISGVAGNIEARTTDGDIAIRNAGADVAAQNQSGDTRIMGAAGSVRVAGRGDDVEIENVGGDAAVEGAFLGSIHLRNVAGMAHCASSNADITAAGLAGTLALDSDSAAISGAHGAVKLVAQDKDIKIADATGPLDITNARGDIEVQFSAPPRDDIRIANDSGGVDLTLPASSGFAISAASRSGEIDNEFQNASLRESSAEENGLLSGVFGIPGPHITIATSYGTIHLRKSR